MYASYLSIPTPRTHFPEQSADPHHYINKQPFNPLMSFFWSLTPNEMNLYKHLKLSPVLAPSWKPFDFPLYVINAMHMKSHSSWFNPQAAWIWNILKIPHHKQFFPKKGGKKANAARKKAFVLPAQDYLWSKSH